jgi:hypothetical protein
VRVCEMPHRFISWDVASFFEKDSYLTLKQTNDAVQEEKKRGYGHRWCAVHPLKQLNPRPYEAAGFDSPLAHETSSSPPLEQQTKKKIRKEGMSAGSVRYTI